MPRNQNAQKKPRLRSPAKWYYFTGDPNVVEVCSYNPDEKEYNKECMMVTMDQLPDAVRAALTKDRNNLSP